ncbi:glycosyltransferase family 1 protein [Nostoc sp. FACHB-892]|uniref:glycosyltransferase n=1 Tax=Nostoc sp. FACHB-892 TaxID=2692843 RepID=UPI0016838FF7|nr:glycosyltransferase [Nostoc sp. FACHB-892]MBD2731597.1 glycosyltransferase family 1 protein [Nostoc sp. FACHB-892]
MNHSSPKRKLKITILTVGSRGDLQPYCALAIGLKRAGHEVTLATHENFEPFVRKFDLKFAPIPGNIQEFLQSKQGQRLIAGEKLNPYEGDKLLLQQLQSAWAACQGSEVIIYTPLANWGYHIAEKLGVPCFFASVLPLAPTGMFGFLRFAQIAKNPLKKAINYGSYFIAEFLYWQKHRKLINSFRTETLKLPPVPYLGRRFRQKTPANVSRIPVLYGFSSHVIPRPRDWPAWVYVTGFWFIDQASEYEPPLELEDFLGRKQLPLCFGFGSMTMPNPEYLTHYIVEALKKTRQGGIILSGWGDVGRTVNVKDSLRVFVIKEVPHDWLFPQVPAVVHHGGASTTAAVLSAGIPSITVPFFADQPVWGEKLSRLGVSPQPIPYHKVSEETLAAAIEVVLRDEGMQAKAQELGEKIRGEDGVANAVEAFHRHLGLIG